jgi:hypothetical protein
MAGVKALRKLVLGREATAGTAVVCTTIWRGMGVLSDDRETVFPEEDIGYLSGVDRAYTPKLEASISMGSVEATFEQLPHILEAGVKTATPAQDSTGSGYVYTYTFPTTAANTLKTYTIEGGDNQAVEEMEYGFVESFTLEGNAGEALMVSAEWKGRQVSDSAFTTTATLPSVDEVLVSKGKVYIDDVDGTIGTTQISNTVLSVKLDVTTGQQAVYTADGNLYFSFVKTVMPEVMLDVTFEHDSNATDEIAAYRAGTPRLIRLEFAGPSLGTAGNFTTKVLRVDLAGKWESFGPLEDTDGNDTRTGTFRARYNATAAKYAEIAVVNELTALP